MADQTDRSVTSAAAKPAQRRSPGLSFKLLLLTMLFVMASAILLYVPSIANFRVTWLKDRLAVAEAAAIVLNASDWTDIPRHVQDDLLAAVNAAGLVLRSGGASRLLASVEQMPEIDRTVDVREDHPVDSILEAIDTLLSTSPRTIRVIGETSGHDSLELVMSNAPLRAAMYRFSANILLSSLIISLLTGALLYLVLNRMLVWPMRRMSDNMTAFAVAPEDASRVIEPSGRTDEIGVAEDHLALMQRDLQATLQQQRRLADLGLAVSKINHDLRNLLASAQLLSDRLRSIPDAAVQSFAPKLIGALDRAITYCQATLAYGRPQEKAPNRKLIDLHALAEDVAGTLGLDVHPAIAWENATPQGMEVDADPDQLFRVLLNLARNAIQAMESNGPGHERRIVLDARRSGGVVTIRVRDSGPGISEKARANLFRAFQGSARSGGTGLGLPIAAELLRAHGGSISLMESEGRGAGFEIVIPDRPLPFAPLERKRG
jgi:signal transduction histidine kinase